MTDKIKEAKEKAFAARDLYHMGLITRIEAKELIAPYIEIFNQKSVEIAKKYGMRPKKISFSGFCR